MCENADGMLLQQRNRFHKHKVALVTQFDGVSLNAKSFWRKLPHRVQFRRILLALHKILTATKCQGNARRQIPLNTSLENPEISCTRNTQNPLIPQLFWKWKDTSSRFLYLLLCAHMKLTDCLLRGCRQEHETEKEIQLGGTTVWRWNTDIQASITFPAACPKNR